MLPCVLVHGLRYTRLYLDRYSNNFRSWQLPHSVQTAIMLTLLAAFSDELVVHMLGFLPTCAVGSAARACSRLRDLCREPLVYISVEIAPQAVRYQRW